MIKEKISCVEAFLIDCHDVFVDFDSNGLDEYWVDNKTITIDSSKNQRHQLRVLLHEAGHAILRDKEDFSQICPDVEKERIETLKEEVLAWEEARKLANNLNIDLGREWILNYRDSLYKYAEWVVNEAS